MTSQFGALELIPNASIEVTIGSVCIPNSGSPKYKKNNWTRNGVFLRNSTQADPMNRSTLLLDCRISATMIPSMNPRTNAPAEMINVKRAPCSNIG